MVQDGPGGAPSRAVRPVAVKRVLSDVEIEGGEVHRAEVMDRGVEALEIISLVGLAHDPVDFGQPVQHPPLQFRHVRGGQPFAFLELRQVSKKVTEGVAETPVSVRLPLEDLLADPDILGIVRADHPESQDIGALGFHQIHRRDHIADGFRHFPTILVDHEAVGQDRLIGGSAARAAAFQQ